MKGIVMAGGTGSRLAPCTNAVSKHLLAVYDKPMIYYSLSALMLAKIRDILIICSPSSEQSFRALLGDGSKFGINLNYKTQVEASGIADAFVLGESFIGADSVCLILGDNIFFGSNFSHILENAIANNLGATIFGYLSQNPSRFGVVELDSGGKPFKIEEKPKNPRSNVVITGLYLFNNDVIEIGKAVLPSSRGEKEITSVLDEYMTTGSLSLKQLGRGFAWLDAGTAESLSDASQFIQTIEVRQGYKIACLEEIALRQGWISPEQAIKEALGKEESAYYKYILDLVRNLA